MSDPVTGVPEPAADEALLSQLTEALRPRVLPPPPASVAALRRAVEKKWRPTARARVMGQLVAWARRLQRPGAAAIVFAGVAVGGTGVALAADGSLPHPVRYTLHALGIPVPSPVVHHDGGGRPAHPSAKVSPQAAPAPTILPPRGAEPVATVAVSQRMLASALPTGRRPSGGSATGLSPWPATAATHRNSPPAWSGWSMPSSDRNPTYGTHGAYVWNSRSDGAASPARGLTTQTARAPASTTGRWRTGPGWTQTAGRFATANGGPATTRAPLVVPAVPGEVTTLCRRCTDHPPTS